MTHQRIPALSCALLIAALSAACDDGIYAMSETFELKGDERIPAGAGCQLALSRGIGGGSSSSAGGGLADGDFSVTEGARGDVFVVVVSSQGEELARREYTEKVLLSGERDQFTVTTQAGRVFELNYWGGEECDTSHLNHDEEE